MDETTKLATITFTLLLTVLMLPCNTVTAHHSEESNGNGNGNTNNLIQDILIRLTAAEKRIQEQDVVIKQLQADMESRTQMENLIREEKAASLDDLRRMLPNDISRRRRDLILSSPLLQHMDSDEVSALESSTPGSVYTRWGRTVCGNKSSLIYEGFAAGPDPAGDGGGSNYQCMPLDPEYNKVNKYTRFGKFASIKLGVKIVGVDRHFLSGAADQIVPCARCHAPRSAQMMIPAKKTCPEGWTSEYEGYLMVHHSTQASTTYECVDSKPEFIRGMHKNANGALFYFIIPDCGVLRTNGHCPPYIANRELTCVLCSK